jgi:hypothetical protein
MQPSSEVVRLVALASVLAMLAGCSEYLDRSDMISPQAGNAVQTNKVVQMVDPWPPESADRDIAFNGTVMQSAAERYRTGRVFPPNGTSTSTSYQASQQNNTAPLGPQVNQPAAPVK